MDPVFIIPNSTVELDVNATSAAVELATGGERDLMVYNAGEKDAFVVFGNDENVFAEVPDSDTPGGFPVPAGAYFTCQRGGATHAAAVCAVDESTTLYFTACRGL